MDDAAAGSGPVGVMLLSSSPTMLEGKKKALALLF